MTNSKFKSACQVVAACSLIAIPIMLPFLILHHLGEHYDRERVQQVKQYRNLAKQKYITIKQFDKLFKSCKKTDNKRVMNNLTNQKVVDSDNGFSYHVVISHFDGEGSCRKATYKLSQIQNGKTAYVDPNWKKTH